MSFRKISLKSHLAWSAEKFQLSQRNVSIATSWSVSFVSKESLTKMDKRSTKDNVLAAKSSSWKISIWSLTQSLRSHNLSREMNRNWRLERLLRNLFSRKFKTNFWARCLVKSKCSIAATKIRSSNACFWRTSRSIFTINAKEWRLSVSHVAK